MVVYIKELVLNGVGFKCFFNKSGNFLLLQLGRSHYIKYDLLSSTIVKVKKNRLLLLSESMEIVGKLASSLENLRQVDCYKLIGVQIKGKNYIKKVGKKR